MTSLAPSKARLALTYVSTYAFVNPLVAVLLGWSIAGEPFSLRAALAAAIIVIAVVIVTTSSRTREPTCEPGLASG